MTPPIYRGHPCPSCGGSILDGDEFRQDMVFPCVDCSFWWTWKMILVGDPHRARIAPRGRALALFEELVPEKTDHVER